MRKKGREERGQRSESWKTRQRIAEVKRKREGLRQRHDELCDGNAGCARKKIM